MACLGSPCTESLPVGIAPSVDPERHADLLGGILRAFERDARNNQCSLLAVKDIASANEPMWRQVAWSAGYRPAAGLPSAALAVDFASMDEYLARLSPGTRRDMRRKLRSRDAVRLERRGNIDDVIDAVMRLYGDTRERAQLKFEELTPAYFQGVLARVPGAFCVLYFAGHDLLAMNLLIEGDGLLLDKFFCMDGNAGRDYNLYFLSWFSNIEYCLSAGLDRYFSGQAGYATKLRLGSTLSGTSMYFRHGNPLVNGVLRASASLFTRSLGVAS
jgi:predicted N-acyltransferase